MLRDGGKSLKSVLKTFLRNTEETWFHKLTYRWTSQNFQYANMCCQSTERFNSMYFWNKMYHRTQSTRKQKAVSTSPNSKEHSLKNNEPNWKLWFHIRINEVQSSSRKDAKRQGIFKSPLTIQSHILNWVAGIQLRLELLHAIILLPMNIGKKAEVGTRKILVWITNSCLLTKSWEPLGLAAMLQMGPPKASTAYLTFKACKSYSIISPLSPALNSRCPFAQHRASVARDSWPGKNYRNTITSQSTMKSSPPSTWVVTGNRVKTKIPP